MFIWREEISVEDRTTLSELLLECKLTNTPTQQCREDRVVCFESQHSSHMIKCLMGLDLKACVSEQHSPFV